MAGVHLLTSDGKAITTQERLPTATSPATAVSSGVIIAINQSVSAEVNLGGATLMMIEMPAVFTGTSLTFQAARATGGTFKNVYDDVRGEVTVLVNADHMVSVDIAAMKLGAAQFLKIRSGTSGTPTVEDAERVLYLITK